MGFVFTPSMCRKHTMIDVQSVGTSSWLCNTCPKYAIKYVIHPVQYNTSRKICNTSHNIFNTYRKICAWLCCASLKRKCHFNEIFITGCTGSWHFATSSAASDENFVKMTTFLSQYLCCFTANWCNCEMPVIPKDMGKFNRHKTSKNTTKHGRVCMFWGCIAHARILDYFIDCCVTRQGICD